MSKAISHRYVVLNERLLEAAAAKLSPLSDGFMYGVGLFETIKILKAQPAFFDQHFDRLQKSAAKLGLPFKTSSVNLRKRCGQIITANGVNEASLKIVVFQDTAGVSELILTYPLRYSDEMYERGFKLKTVLDDSRRNEFHRLKTLNYLKNHHAKQAAQAAGFDEALFIDPNSLVLEGATTNIFAMKNGKIMTPLLAQNILPGIARGRILELTSIDSEPSAPLFSLQQLLEADEVFVTNSLLGVMPVASVDGHTYDLNKYSVIKMIGESYRQSELQSIR